MGNVKQPCHPWENFDHSSSFPKNISFLTSRVKFLLFLNWETQVGCNSKSKISSKTEEWWQVNLLWIVSNFPVDLFHILQWVRAGLTLGLVNTFQDAGNLRTFLVTEIYTLLFDNLTPWSICPKRPKIRWHHTWTAPYRLPLLTWMYVTDHVHYKYHNFMCQQNTPKSKTADD